MKKLVLRLSLFIIILITLSQINIKSNENSILNLGFIENIVADANINDAKVAIQVWLNHISSKFGILKSNVIMIKNIENAEENIKKNLIDYIVLNGYEYSKLKKYKAMEPVAAAVMNGSVFANFLIVVNKEIKIKNLNDLKNKKVLIYPSRMNQIIKEWLENIIFENYNITPEAYFDEIKYVDRINQAILPVFFMNYDACIVPSHSYLTSKKLNPQLEKKLLTIEQSPNFVMGIICVNKNIVTNQRKKLIDAIFNLQNDPKGKLVLSLFKIDKIIPYQEHFINTTVENENKNKELKMRYVNRNSKKQKIRN